MTSRIDKENLIEAFWNGERAPSNCDFVGFVFKPQFTRELEGGVVTSFLSRSAELFEKVCDIIASKPDMLRLL